MYSRLLPTSRRSVLKQRTLELDEARQTETSTLPRFTSFSKARRRRGELRRHCHYMLPPVPLHTQCREQYFNGLCTGKSFSEALILGSVNPQYDNRCSLNYEFSTSKIQVQNMLCTKIVLNVKKTTKKQFLYTTCSALVFFLF